MQHVRYHKVTTVLTCARRCHGAVIFRQVSRSSRQKPHQNTTVFHHARNSVRTNSVIGETRETPLRISLHIYAYIRRNCRTLRVNALYNLSTIATLNVAYVNKKFIENDVDKISHLK